MAKTLRHEQGMEILQKTYELSDRVRGPREYGLRLFMRTTAHHQFYLQDDISKSKYARQSIIFDHLPDNHKIARKFKEITGLSPSYFTKLSLVSLTRLLTQADNKIPYHWYSRFYNYVPKESVEAYIRLVSKSLPEMRDWLNQNHDGRIRSSEYHEPTPFIKVPFLRDQQHLVSFYPEVFYRSIETYIYDILREHDKENFMNQFGEIFEKYTEVGIREYTLNYHTESQLKEILPPKTKVVDFVIEEGDARVFIDSKAVEISMIGITTESEELLANETKNSLTKAFQQAHETLSGLNQVGTFVSSENYLIVVTYKEFFLGNGSDYYQNIAKERWDRVYKEFGGQHPIPTENVYFVNIEDFDWLMEYLKISKSSLIEFMRKVVADDNERSTRKMILSQHIKEMGQINTPSWLQNHFDSLYKELMNSVT